MRMIIHKSRKKAVCITVAGLLAGIAGGLVLYYVRDVVLGWCFVITAGFALLYGIGSLFDRRPYIVLTEYGITEPFAIREQIEWDAVLYADDFYFRGQYWVRLLLGRDYKPQLIRPAWFWRLVHKPTESQGGLYPYDGTGGRFDAAGRTDPQDERGGYVREDRTAPGIPFGVTRNPVYCFSRFVN